jgi:hypothetical protein
MSKEVIHYALCEHCQEENRTYCGMPYKEREFPEFRPPLFTSNKSQVTCRRCQQKIKKEEELQKKLEAYCKELEKEIDGDWDGHQLGYSEAILNLLGEFSNGQCADCPFSYEIETNSPDFITPEYGLKCSLEKCWIIAVKDIIRGA